MRIRQTSTGPAKVELNMTPMIDVVFQLMIFFMLTLKITSAEGDFSVNMPPRKAGGPPRDPVSEVKVRLTANTDGTLADLRLGRRSLGAADRAFADLNSEIVGLYGPPGNPLMQDVPVEIDADYDLNYQAVVKAITACTGRIDPATRQVIRYVEKIKFAPPRPPREE
jgi:biopolymer transport protein ExbD